LRYQAWQHLQLQHQQLLALLRHRRRLWQRLQRLRWRLSWWLWSQLA
jgi:hypothetical protein